VVFRRRCDRNWASQIIAGQKADDAYDWLLPRKHRASLATHACLDEMTNAKTVRTVLRQLYRDSMPKNAYRCRRLQKGRLCRRMPKTKGFLSFSAYRSG
jgi:hypothetical protein